MVLALYATYFVFFSFSIRTVSNAKIEHAAYPLITTNIGLVRGLKAKDGDYSMFLGLPYANINITNPFGESLPHPHFKTVFEANDDSAMCPQQEEFNNTIVGNLDCLRLNIYAPNSASPANLLPVLVYIYGGRFKIGFARTHLYGPKYLVRHGIILVTLNYRLGPYGFFCTHTPDVPGNQGYKDQIKALKWIQENIEAFGGDLDKITASGHSFGATSIDYILHSLNENEKLLDKAIIQSPSIYCPDAYKGEPGEKVPLQLANYLGFKTRNVNEALSFISTVDTDSVIAAAVNLSTPYAYCIEKKIEGVQYFMGDFPVNLELPAVKNMPILIGNTNDEAFFEYDHKPGDFDYYRIFYDALYLFDFGDDYHKEMEGIVRRYYIGDNNKTDKLVTKDINSFLSDYFYCHLAIRNIRKYIENGAKDVFYYVFSFNGGRNYAKLRYNITGEGARHGDELGYLFDMSLMDNNPTPEDQLVIDRITLLWANFVKYGDPTPNTSELLPVKWRPFTKGAQYYLNIDSKLSLSSAPLNRRMAFWDLFFELNEKMQRGYRRKTGAK